MEKEKTIVNYFDLNVTVETKAGEELLEHLSTSVLGTPGRLRYKQTRIAEKLSYISEAYFLLLRKGSRMLGSVGLCFRESDFNSKLYTTWYVRYFSIKAPLKSGKPSPEKLMERSGRGLSLLRQVSAPYLDKPGENLKNLEPGTEKSLVYAYIEKENFQSEQFAHQNNFVSARKFSTFLFFRFWPQRNYRIEKLSDDDKDIVRKELKSFYNDHSFYIEHYLFFKNNYFIYRENGIIVAGLQANPDMWEIKEMGGLSGKFLVHVLPYIPGIRNIFNPRKLKFIAADYIFWKPGHENKVSELFETVCNLNRTGLLMAWADTGSKLSRTFSEYVRQGLIARMNKKVEVDVKIKFNGYSEEEKRVFYDNPCFVSSFDVT